MNPGPLGFPGSPEGERPYEPSALTRLSYPGAADLYLQAAVFKSFASGMCRPR